MTDPTTERRYPDSGHPDLETLADLDAGVLDETVELRRHLDGCAACTDLVGQLQDTRVLLADLPPPALPVAVAERLDAAVRTASAGPGAAPAVTVLPIRPDRARHAAGRPRWQHPAAIAASIVLVLGALTGVGAILSHRVGPEATSSATSGAVRDKAAPPPLALTASGRDYGPATLDGGVRGLLGVAPLDGQKAAASAAPPGNTQFSGREVDPALTRLSGPAALQACLDELAGHSGAAAITVDLARYRGRPAAIVVLPDADPAKVDAWIVGGGCRRGQPDLVRYQVVRRAG